MTLANIYLDADTDTKEQMLNEASFGQMQGTNEFGSYVISIYTFSDGTSIGFMGDFDADLLELILAELP